MTTALLIKNVTVYAPEELGVRDIFCVGRRIVKVAPGIDAFALQAAFGGNLEMTDGEGLLCVPGLVDPHMHFNGAGAGQPQFRTPPSQLSELTRAGITTAIGPLGMDGVTRSLEDLYMKARALENEGISTWMYTGSYQSPSPTITGGIARDICVIDKVVGLKLSYADHRSSQPDDTQFINAVAAARVGGIAGGKSGKVMLHMGGAPDGLERVRRIIGRSEVPLDQIIPTHLNRTPQTLDAAKEHGLAGGNVDITAVVSDRYNFTGTVNPEKAVADLLGAGVPVRRISLSSDANGSISVPEGGKMVVKAAPAASMYFAFIDMIKEGIPLPDAARIASTNTADNLGLAAKGRIGEGADADLLLIVPGTYALRMVFAKGRKMVQDGVPLVKGTFEA